MILRRAFLLFLGGYLLCCVAASVVSFRSRPSGLISSDGKGYYAWLRSVALDRDLDFRNDYRLLYPPEPLPPEVQRRTARGLVPNKYPVGVAVVEIPGFLAGHVIALALDVPRDGVSAPYQYAVTVWLQLLCVTAIWVLWLGLLRLGVDAVVATLTVVSALCATNLVHYIASPSMSHGPGLAILCFAFYAAVAARAPDRQLAKLILAGALLGLAVIIRPSNIALAPFFLVFLADPLRRSAANWLGFAASFALLVALQVGMMSQLWGQFAVSGYTDEGFTSGVRGLLGTLFSSRHGLFVYHPWYLLMLLLCIAGITRPESRAVSIGAVASFAALTVINGTWSTWWFGDSFGNRAFVEIIPTFVAAGAVTLNSLESPRRSRAVVAFVVTALVLSLSNTILWTGFILHRYPANGEHSIAQAYLWLLHS